MSADASVTEEADWRQMLASAPAWTPPSEAGLIVVSAHPDDEIFGAGGLIHAVASAGRPATVVSVTDGEAAFPDWEKLDLVRRAELTGALRRLSTTHITVQRIGLPDGRVAEYANRVHNALSSLLQPGFVLAAPFEHDGHPDHEVVGKICIDLARSHACTLLKFPIWAWHRRTLDELKNERWVKFALGAEAQRAKARALPCFASQVDPPRRAPIAGEEFLKHFDRPYEAFIV